MFTVYSGVGLAIYLGEALDANYDELLLRVSGVLICLLFWSAGTAVLVSRRPRNGLWRAMILFNCGTAVWLVAAVVSPWRVAYASLALHALSWLILPISWYLHLILVRPLSRRPARLAIVSLFLIAAVLAALELGQLLPDGLYVTGLWLAVFGSLTILVYQLLHAPTERDRLRARILLVGIALCLVPGIAFAVLPAILPLPAYDSSGSIITILGVLFLPYFYIYAVYRNELGNREIWLKRLLSLYAFVLAYSIAFVALVWFSEAVLSLPTSSVTLNLVLSALVGASLVSLRTLFPGLVGRLAYGIAYSHEDIRYATVFQSMGAAAVITNQDYRIVAVNSLAETLLGQRASSLAGQLWYDLFSLGSGNAEATSEVGASFWRLESDASSAAGCMRTRGRFPLRANGEVVLDVISTPIQVNGQLEGYIHILHDFSAQEKFAQARDQFLLSVAHELAGPLSSWRASLDIMIEDYATVSTRDLGVMLRSLQRTTIKLENLVATLVDIGRIQAGRFVVRPARMRVSQLIMDSVTPMEPLLKVRGQRLKLNIESVAQCAVLADRQRIGQVIGNLLKNASKYAPEDKPISLSAFAEDGFVFIEVADQGPGIAVEEQEQLFKRFYRAKRIEHEGAGIGIGLALVKGIVEAHGGQVGVRSHLGEGATFWFSLPEVSPAAAETRQSAADFIAGESDENPLSG